MKLLTSYTSPFGRKVRVIVLEKQLNQVEVVNSNAWEANSVVATHNPLGKVPVLVLDNNDVIFDSALIAEYLDHLNQNVTPLFATNNFDLNIQIKRAGALGDGITEASVLIFIEKNKRSENQQSQEWIDRQLGKIRASLKFLSEHYDLSQEFLFDNRLTIADINIVCALDYLKLRMPNIDFASECPAPFEYAKRLVQRESFKLTDPNLA